MLRTHCRRGHAYDEANTYTDRRGGRHCRACAAERYRERVGRPTVKVARACKHCGGGVPPSARIDAEYCSPACRTLWLYYHAGGECSCGCGEQVGRGAAYKQGHRWNRENVLEVIRREAARTGMTPSTRSWGPASDDKPGRDTIKLMFGSWNAAMEEAGLSPRPAGSGNHYNATAAWAQRGGRQMVTGGQGYRKQIFHGKYVP